MGTTLLEDTRAKSVLVKQSGGVIKRNIYRSIQKLLHWNGSSFDVDQTYIYQHLFKTINHWKKDYKSMYVNL
jgi:hypothetical protein